METVSNKTSGGSAFPNDGKWANGYPDGGMSLRDWFAGQGMGALITRGFTTRPEDTAEVARRAYAFADAMLARRELP